MRTRSLQPRHCTFLVALHVLRGGRMRRATLLLGWLGATLLAAFVGCEAGDGDSSHPSAQEAGTMMPDAGAGDAADASDPRCATQATLLGTHPHASQQPTPLGKTISDTRGWMGLLYFGYGDIELNTGPIYITTFDPKSNTWADHPVAYLSQRGAQVVTSTPAFATHDIERFLPIGDSLWAPAAQPDFKAPFDAASAPEYAIATGGNDWTQVDFVPNSIHLVDAIARAPSDIYFTGSAFMSTDAAVGAVANGRAGGYVWRSVDGGPFAQLFPNFAASTEASEDFDLTGAWIFGAALNGTAYLDEDGFVYEHDGGAGLPVPAWNNWEDVGEFLTPATFAGQIVFADLGQFYAYDGTSRTDLNFRFFESQGRYQATMEPLVLFQVTEGRLLAVKYGGDVMMTTDLKSWTCIGQAPADASSIGSLDGVVYFGSVNSGVYGFPAPSW
jgi:hypothetical protein